MFLLKYLVCPQLNNGIIFGRCFFRHVNYSTLYITCIYMILIITCVIGFFLGGHHLYMYFCVSVLVSVCPFGSKNSHCPSPPLPSYVFILNYILFVRPPQLCILKLFIIYYITDYILSVPPPYIAETIPYKQYQGGGG